MTAHEDRLGELTERLREAAARLRADAVPPEDVAELIEECARLAADAGAELDRRARPPSG
jgi:hypothetical protein